MITLAGMFGFSEDGRLPLISGEAVYYLKSYFGVFVIGFLGATPLPRRLFEKLVQKKHLGQLLTVVEPLLLLLLVLVVTAYLVDGSFNPFLYFRF